MKPTRRNALQTILIPVVLFAISPPLGALLGGTHFAIAPSVTSGAALILSGLFIRTMVAELNGVSATPLVWWHVAIPFYGIYWVFKLVPEQMALAKQKAGKGAPRGALAYLFLFPWAFASDLNDLA